MKTEFKYMRQKHGAFCVYLCEGKPEQVGRPHAPLVEPTSRAQYPNAQAIIRGYLDCHGPDGRVRRFEEGMADTELPGYEVPGKYLFKPGPGGVLYYCISRCPAFRPVVRRIVTLKAHQTYTVTEGRLFVLVSGTVTSGEKVFAPPLIADATEEEKTFTALGAVKGLEVWD